MLPTKSFPHRRRRRPDCSTAFVDVPDILAQCNVMMAARFLNHVTAVPNGGLPSHLTDPNSPGVVYAAHRWRGRRRRYRRTDVSIVQRLTNQVGAVRDWMCDSTTVEW